MLVKRLNSDMFIKNCLRNLIYIYTFLITLFGDYFDYYERATVTPIPNLNFVLDTLKFLIIIICCYYTIKYRQVGKIKPIFFILILLQIIGSFINIHPINLNGQYIIISTNEKMMSGYGINGVMIRSTFAMISNLIFAALIGLIFKDDSEFMMNLLKCMVMTFPFHALNALLQFRSFFLSWGKGAIFFMAPLPYSIIMRTTGLFEKAFAYVSFLIISEIYALNYMKYYYKIIFLLIIFLLLLTTLTRSGIILFFTILLYDKLSCFRKSKVKKFNNKSGLFNIIVFISIILFLLSFIFVIDLNNYVWYFNRFTIPLNFHQNYSLYSRIHTPLINLTSLFSKDFIFSLIGTGNSSIILSDSAIIADIYRYGLLFTIGEIMLFSNMWRIKKAAVTVIENKVSKEIFIFWLLAGFLFSGMSSAPAFVIYTICSMFLYSNNYVSNLEENIKDHGSGIVYTM